MAAGLSPRLQVPKIQGASTGTCTAPFGTSIDCRTSQRLADAPRRGGAIRPLAGCQWRRLLNGDSPAACRPGASGPSPAAKPGGPWRLSAAAGRTVTRVRWRGGFPFNAPGPRRRSFGWPHGPGRRARTSHVEAPGPSRPEPRPAARLQRAGAAADCRGHQAPAGRERSMPPVATCAAGRGSMPFGTTTQ
jgi:hypothetical protein